MSDDGETAIVIIALLGNPFSPRYAAARARGPASPLSFCAMNVALYRRSASVWCLEERRLTELHRTASGVAIGGSVMRWSGDALTVEIDERATHLWTPWRRPVRGRVVLRPEVCPGLDLAIDAGGHHRWWPVAPLARIEVDLPEPGVRFSGHGYHDVNAGDGPLESSFESWHWSRGRTPRGAVLTYDVESTTGQRRSLSFAVSPSGERRDLEEPRSSPLGRTRWGLERVGRVDPGAPTRVLRSLEDGPFYARALVETRLDGHPVVAMHESLALHRFRRRLVQGATTYRMRHAP